MDRLLVDFQSVVLYPIYWLDFDYFIHVCAVCSTIGIFGGKRGMRRVFIITPAHVVLICIYLHWDPE